jgi:hypothetical protein
LGSLGVVTVPRRRIGSVTELAYDRKQAADFLMFMTSSRMATAVIRPP